MRGGDHHLCEEQQRRRDRYELWQGNEGNGLQGCKTLQGTGSLEEESEGAQVAWRRKKLSWG